MKRSKWLVDLFNNCTNGEFQSSKSISYPIRQKISHPKPDQYPFFHSIGTKRVPSVNIPASTMNKFRDYINGVPGGWKPSDATVERLRKFRDSLNYHRLRASGCSTTEARRLKRSPDIERDLAILRKTAQVIADQKNIPLAAVLWANRRSDRLVQDWEKYVKAKFSLVLDDEEFDEDAEWDDYLDSESGISETDASNDDMDGDYL